ncbi:hypothetical protein [Abyssogena phaseoliformis symbiont]|uniref:hypothetical protein n=1 Tax=Abyssogena phaseoliformis symbiont TaxID=596095 RepID=UPI001914E5BC|nr:hypothetical protein [Abyssogena phaseoliformis symbiont]
MAPQTHDAVDSALQVFFEMQIATSYFDAGGVLTFVLNLPIAQNFNQYLHKITIIDTDNKVVVNSDTPRVALVKGIGGTVTIKKVAIATRQYWQGCF